MSFTYVPPDTELPPVPENDKYILGTDFAKKYDFGKSRQTTVTTGSIHDIKPDTDFIDHLFKGTSHVIELRALPLRKTLFTRDMTEVVNFCETYKDQNLYFGVGTREGGRGKKENVREIPALFVDIDFEKISEKEAWERLSLFPLKPSAIINSGNGFHVYWFLQTPFTSALEIEPYLKGIATNLCADPTVAECAHILRVPGTINHKYPKEVIIVEFSPAIRYDISVFSGFAQNDHLREKCSSGAQNKIVLQEAGAIASPPEMKTCISKMLSTRFEKNGRISRNKVSVAITSELMRLGYSEKVIYTEILQWNGNNINSINEDKLVENVRLTLGKPYNYSCLHELLQQFCPYHDKSDCIYGKKHPSGKYLNNRPFLHYGWQNILNNTAKDIYYIALPELERRKGAGPGGRIIASQEEICHWAGVSKKSLKSALEELERFGLISHTPGTPRVWERKATQIQRVIPIPKPSLTAEKNFFENVKKVTT